MEHELLPFEVVADGWQDAVFLLNSSGAILWVNQAAATVVGRSIESLLSLTLTDILTPRSSEVEMRLEESQKSPLSFFRIRAFKTVAGPFQGQQFNFNTTAIQAISHPNRLLISNVFILGSMN